MPTLLTDSALAVIDRFIAAARHKPAPTPDSSTTFESTPAYGENDHDIDDQIDVLSKNIKDHKALLNDSLSPEQQKLHEKYQHLHTHADLYSFEEIEACKQRFTDTFNTQQREWSDTIEQMQEERFQLGRQMLEKIFGLNRKSPDNITIPIPTNLSISEKALPNILNEALKCISGRKFSSLSLTLPFLFTCSPEDVHYTFQNKHGKAFPFNALKAAIINILQPILANADHWKKVKTPHGMGYAISRPYLSHGSKQLSSEDEEKFATLGIVRSIALTEEFKDNCHVFFTLYQGGAEITVPRQEFRAIEQRKKEQGKRIKARENLVLTGDTAQTILHDMLGVDMEQIKDASRQR